jgi:hypothetical protein
VKKKGPGLNLGHLISHKAHGVRRKKSKKLCDLPPGRRLLALWAGGCGLCEMKGRCVLLSKILMVDIITNPEDNFIHVDPILIF